MVDPTLDQLGCHNRIEYGEANSRLPRIGPGAELEPAASDCRVEASRADGKCRHGHNKQNPNRHLPLPPWRSAPAISPGDLLETSRPGRLVSQDRHVPLARSSALDFGPWTEDPGILPGPEITATSLSA